LQRSPSVPSFDSCVDNKIIGQRTDGDQNFKYVWVGIDVNAGHFRDELKQTKIVVASGGAKRFEPDYMCFLGYAWVVLNYLDNFHPEAEKVDFVVEHKMGITKHIQEFHSHLSSDLKSIGSESLGKLVGQLIPSGKERIPLQAADVLCWHTGRARRPETMDAADIRRYKTLAHRKGTRVPLSKKMIRQLKDAVLQRAPNKFIRIAP
jgi:hypothetical protein